MLGVPSTTGRRARRRWCSLSTRCSTHLVSRQAHTQASTHRPTGCASRLADPAPRAVKGSGLGRLNSQPHGDPQQAVESRISGPADRGRTWTFSSAAGKLKSLDSGTSSMAAPMQPGPTQAATAVQWQHAQHPLLGSPASQGTPRGGSGGAHIAPGHQGWATSSVTWTARSSPARCQGPAWTLTRPPPGPRLASGHAGASGAPSWQPSAWLPPSSAWRSGPGARSLPEAVAVIPRPGGSPWGLPQPAPRTSLSSLRAEHGLRRLHQPSLQPTSLGRALPVRSTAPPAGAWVVRSPHTQPFQRTCRALSSVRLRHPALLQAEPAPGGRHHGGRGGRQARCGAPGRCCQCRGPRQPC